MVRHSSEMLIQAGHLDGSKQKQHFGLYLQHASVFLLHAWMCTVWRDRMVNSKCDSSFESESHQVHFPLFSVWNFHILRQLQRNYVNVTSSFQNEGWCLLVTSQRTKTDKHQTNQTWFESFKPDISRREVCAPFFSDDSSSLWCKCRCQTFRHEIPALPQYRVASSR